MTANHIDQLAEWWENAERGAIRAGDTVIQNHRTAPDEYTVYVAEQPSPDSGEYVRILARAPKPRPAWHNAVAVIAHTARFSERRPFALTHTEDVLDPYNTEWITRDDLIDPAPLIEAKVTDEMVKAARQEAKDRTGVYWARSHVSRMLTAALGLEAV